MSITTAFTLLVALAQQTAGPAAPRPLPFRDGGWQLSGEGSRVVTEEKGDVLALGTGMAVRRDVRLEDGTIDFDVRMTRRRSFVYIMFRIAGDGEHEEIYLRPHKSGLPDAVQYAPAWQDQSAWQLFHGPGATAAPELRTGTWTHVRLVVQNRSAALFLDDMAKPALVVPRLARDPAPGHIALQVFTPGEARAPVAHYANVTVRSGYVPYTFETAAAAPEPDGVVRAWSVSRAFPPRDQDGAALPADAVLGEFSRVEALPGGLVTLDRFVKRPDGGAAAVARIHVRAAEAGTYAFDLGFSDIATVFLNGRPLVRGNASYSFDAPRRDGVIGFDQARVYLPLAAGDNELSVLVSDTFGGWGVMGRFVDGASKLTVEAR